MGFQQSCYDLHTVEGSPTTLNFMWYFCDCLFSIIIIMRNILFAFVFQTAGNIPDVAFIKWGCSPTGKGAMVSGGELCFLWVLFQPFMCSLDYIQTKIDILISLCFNEQCHCWPKSYNKILVPIVTIVFLCYFVYNAISWFDINKILEIQMMYHIILSYYLHNLLNCMSYCGISNTEVGGTTYLFMLITINWGK